MKVVAFDFDGTLIHSNEKKSQIIQKFFGEVGVPESVHSAWTRNSPNRFELAQLAANYIGKPDQFGCLVRRLSNGLDEVVLNCELRIGVISALRWLFFRGVKVCLNSATPETNLNRIVRQIPEISRFIHKVYGCPSSKIDNLFQIATDFSVSTTDILVVGDGVDDLEVATASQSPFIGIRGGSLSDVEALGITFLDDLNDLQLSFARIKNRCV